MLWVENNLKACPCRPDSNWLAQDIGGAKERPCNLVLGVSLGDAFGHRTLSIKVWEKNVLQTMETWTSWRFCRILSFKGRIWQINCLESREEMSRYVNTISSRPPRPSSRWARRSLRRPSPGDSRKRTCWLINKLWTHRSMVCFGYSSALS